MSRDRQEEAADALRIFRRHAPDLPVVAVFVVGQQDDKVCFTFSFSNRFGIRMLFVFKFSN